MFAICEKIIKTIPLKEREVIRVGGWRMLTRNCDTVFATINVTDK